MAEKNEFTIVKWKSKNKDWGEQNVQFTAQYNPTELTKTLTNKWEDRKEQEVTFLGAQESDFSHSLLVDGYEPDKGPQHVEEQVGYLEALATAADGDSPPICILNWGWAQSRYAVVQSYTVKYTMFSPAGEPLRAQVDITFKPVTRGHDTDVDQDNAKQTSE